MSASIKKKKVACQLLYYQMVANRETRSGKCARKDGFRIKINQKFLLIYLFSNRNN